MNIRQQIKQNARRALGASWGKAICIFLIMASIFIVFSLMQGVLSLIFGIPDIGDVFLSYYYYPKAAVIIPPVSLAMAAVFSAFSMLINSPLTFGVKGWYFSIISGETEDIGAIFLFFSHIRLLLKAIWHDINITIRLCLWSIVFALIPGGICAVAGLILQNPKYVELYRLGGIILLMLGLLLAVLSQIFFIIFSNKYFLSAYLIVEDTTLTVSKAIKTSAAYTKGSRGALFMLSLSFIPWALFSVLLVPLLYFVPYYSASKALYAKYLIERGKLNTHEDKTVSFDINDANDNITEEIPNISFREPVRKTTDNEGLDDKPLDGENAAEKETL